MEIIPFSQETLLTVIATLVAAAIPLVYRYVWGSMSRISLSRRPTISDSEWRDVRDNGTPIWTRRILIRASNNGWRDGIISQIMLDEVVLTGNSSHTIDNPEKSIHKIGVEHYDESGEKTCLTFKKRTDYKGQIVKGRDDELFGIIPAVLQESELGTEMKKADRFIFKFTFFVEDNKRSYSTSIEIPTYVHNSAGRRLRCEESDPEGVDH